MQMMQGAEICHFYAEIVKYGLIVTLLKLSGGEGQETYLEVKITPCSCGAATV